jgi:hypothetical protein
MAHGVQVFSASQFVSKSSDHFRYGVVLQLLTYDSLFSLQLCSD